MYDYRQVVKKDVIAWIEDHFEKNYFISIREKNRDDLYQSIWDDCFVSDQVTGNESGSYTCNAYESFENLRGNLDLLVDACKEFCCEPDLVGKGAEWCDVTIRCYVLGEVLSDAISEAFED